MKILKFLITIIILIISTPTYSQNWYKNYPTAGDDYANSIIYYNNNLYINVINSSNCKLIKTDMNGNVINTTVFNNLQYISTLLLSHDNNIILVGNDRTSNGIVVIKLDLSFNVIWTYKFNSNSYNYAESAIVNSNGDITICGFTSSGSSSTLDRDGLLIRINNIGQTLWSKRLTFGGSDYFSGICEGPNGKILLTGAYQGGAGQMDLFLYFVNSSGDLISSKLWGGTQNDGGYSIDYYNNHFYVSGNTWSAGVGQQDIALLKLDTTLDLKFSKTYGGSGIEPGLYVTHNSLGEILIVGQTTSVPSKSRDLCILFTNDLGAIIKSKNIGSNNDEVIGFGYKNILELGGVYYIVGSSKNNSTDYDLLLTKNDLNTNDLCCNYLQDFVAQTTVASIVFNPIATSTVTNNPSTSFTLTKSVGSITSSSTCIPNGTISASINTTSLEFCKGKPVTFIGNSNFTTAAYSWNFNDLSSGINNTSNIKSTTHTFANPGNYNITLIASNGCVSDTDTLHITIIDEFIKSTISTTQINYCSGSTINFQPNIIGTASSFQWNFGDPMSGSNNTSFNNSPTHSYYLPGTYSIWVIVQNNCNADTDTLTINVIEGSNIVPVINSIKTSYCAGQSVNFLTNHLNPGNTFSWTFGDPSSGINNSSSNSQPNHTFLIPGIYQVKLIIENNCKSDTDTILINVIDNNPIITSISTIQNTFCTGNIIDFKSINTGIVNQYLWNYGDPSSGINNNSTDSNGSHIYLLPGTYEVAFIIKNDCRTDTDTISINVIEGQNIKINILTNQTVFCNNQTVNFTSNVIGIANTFLWNFDDPSSGTNNTSNLSSQDHHFNIPGIYNITLIIQNQCKSDTDTIQITILPEVILNGTINLPSASFCIKDSLRFNGSSNDINTTYYWSIYNINNNIIKSSNLEDPTFIFDTSGSYKIKLITNNICHSDTDSTIINIKGLVKNTITTNKITYCENETVNFNSILLGNVSSVIWDFGDKNSGINNTSNELNPSHNFNNKGIYTIRQIAIGACNSDTDSILIFVSANKELITFINPLVNTYCKGDTVSFEAIGNDINASYSWDFGDLNSGANNISTIQNPIHVFKNDGVYLCTLLSKNECRQNLDTISIKIGLSYSPDFEILMDSCTGKILLNNLTENLENNSYQWLLDDTKLSETKNADINLEINGTYTIGLLMNPSTNCKDSVFKIYNFTKPNPTQSIIIPNVFTPNEDGINDFYEINPLNRCALKSMSIYNRWGKKLYESSSVLKWDGKSNNVNCSNGTYIVYLEFEDKIVTQTIELLR